MLIRTKKGELQEFKSKNYVNDKEKFVKLWKLKYDIDFAKKSISFNESLIKYIRGEKKFV